MNVGDEVSSADYCIINTSGSIMKGSSAYKDADENYYRISNGKITYSDKK